MGIETKFFLILIGNLVFVSYPCVGIETVCNITFLFSAFLLYLTRVWELKLLQLPIRDTNIELYLTRVWELKPPSAPMKPFPSTCILPVCGNWNERGYRSHIWRALYLTRVWELKLIGALRAFFSGLVVSYPCVGIETLQCISLAHHSALYLTRMWELKHYMLGIVHCSFALYLTRVWELKRLKRKLKIPNLLVSYPCVGIETPSIFFNSRYVCIVSYPCVGIETKCFFTDFSSFFCILPVCGNWNSMTAVSTFHISPFVSYPCVGIETI